MLELVCECAELSCRARIRVPRDLFEQVAGDAPQRFMMTPAHADGSTRVVEQRSDFVVVEVLESPVRLDGLEVTSIEQPPEFRLEVEHHNGATIVTVHGELDLDTAPKLRALLGDVATAAGSSVEVDLTDVGFLDSSGLATILDARRVLASGGGRLVVVCPPPLRRIFELAGVTELLDLGDSQA